MTERFCKALWQDADGLYCSTKAAESRSVCHCPYTEENCCIEDGKIRCRGETYACEDFEPADWLIEKLLPVDWVKDCLKTAYNKNLNPPVNLEAPITLEEFHRECLRICEQRFIESANAMQELNQSILNAIVAFGELSKVIPTRRQRLYWFIKSHLSLRRIWVPYSTVERSNEDGDIEKEIYVFGFLVYRS